MNLSRDVTETVPVTLGKISLPTGFFPPRKKFPNETGQQAEIV
jgi:hypothetical protein